MLPLVPRQLLAGQALGIDRDHGEGNDHRAAAHAQRQRLQHRARRGGQREVVGNFPGMTFSPRFSPDGQKIVMSLSQGAQPSDKVAYLLKQAAKTAA
mgnify:CR=1 FL=1